jgi:hypothetical protein
MEKNYAARVFPRRTPKTVPPGACALCRFVLKRLQVFRSKAKMVFNPNCRPEMDVAGRFWLELPPSAARAGTMPAPPKLAAASFPPAAGCYVA